MVALFNLKKASLLLIAAFQCAILVSARPSHAELTRREFVDGGNLTTNAKRFQAGLAPLKPRNLYNPSRVVARAPMPSNLPPVSGNLVVKRADGSVIGYISTEDYGFVTTSSSNRMLVSFYPNNPPFNIAVSGMSFPDLGFLGSSSLNTNGNSLSLITTNPTAPGATPQDVGNPYGTTPPTESAVWYYNAVDSQLTAQWVNPDGTVLFPSFVYSTVSTRLGITLAPGSNQVFLYLE